jgi:hypothetical protein
MKKSENIYPITIKVSTAIYKRKPHKFIIYTMNYTTPLNIESSEFFRIIDCAKCLHLFNGEKIYSDKRFMITPFVDSVELIFRMYGI